MVTVRQGRYALTRAQAAVALGAVKSHAALAMLTRATSDTSVMVRRAALQGLEALQMSEGVMVERSVFAHDPSPLVRADALQSVLLSPWTSSEDRQTFFAQGLSQQTYRDVVPIVALKVMGIHYCDSTTMATFRKMLGTPGVTKRVQAILPTLTLTIPACQSSFVEQLHAALGNAQTGAQSSPRRSSINLTNSYRSNNRWITL